MQAVDIRQFSRLTPAWWQATRDGILPVSLAYPWLPWARWHSTWESVCPGEWGRQSSGFVAQIPCPAYDLPRLEPEWRIRGTRFYNPATFLWTPPVVPLVHNHCSDQYAHTYYVVTSEQSTWQCVTVIYRQVLFSRWFHTIWLIAAPFGSLPKFCYYPGFPLNIFTFWKLISSCAEGHMASTQGKQKQQNITCCILEHFYGNYVWSVRENEKCLCSS